jgi:hypothetical protein
MGLETAITVYMSVLFVIMFLGWLAFTVLEGFLLQKKG